MTLNLTDTTFNESILTAEEPLVLVDFWAEWCGPCKSVAPILDELDEYYGDDVLIAKVDVDDNTATAKAYDVRSIPTMILFKGGEKVAERSGAASKAVLSDWIDEYK